MQKQWRPVTCTTTKLALRICPAPAHALCQLWDALCCTVTACVCLLLSCTCRCPCFCPSALWWAALLLPFPTCRVAAALVAAYEAVYQLLDDPTAGYAEQGGSVVVKHTPTQVRTILGVL